MKTPGPDTSRLAGGEAGARLSRLSFLTGQEPVADLRNMIVHYSQTCPVTQNDPQGPFRILSSLDYASLTALVKEMSRETCLNLFEQEFECRSRSGNECRLAGKKAGAITS